MGKPSSVDALHTYDILYIICLWYELSKEVGLLCTPDLGGEYCSGHFVGQQLDTLSTFELGPGGKALPFSHGSEVWSFI